MTSPSALRPFERTLARVMFLGVWLSAGCLALALSALLVSPHFAPAETLLRIGLLILMATPVMRVALSVGEALRQRDWFWLWTTVAVTVVLVGTMVYSLRTGGSNRRSGDQENPVTSLHGRQTLRGSPEFRNR